MTCTELRQNKIRQAEDIYAQQLHERIGKLAQDTDSRIECACTCNWKDEKSPPEQQYASSEGVALTTQGNHGVFSGDCHNYGKSRNMAWECPELRKK